MVEIQLYYERIGIFKLKQYFKPKCNLSAVSSNNMLREDSIFFVSNLALDNGVFLFVAVGNS